MKNDAVEVAVILLGVVSVGLLGAGLFVASILLVGWPLGIAVLLLYTYAVTLTMVRLDSRY